MFRVMKTGKRMKKSWKRMITKATFVGEGFTRKPPKYERFIRPTVRSLPLPQQPPIPPLSEKSTLRPRRLMQPLARRGNSH